MAIPTTFEIFRSDLACFQTPNDAHVTDVKHLASYNWIEASTPSITVPGCPPVWSDIRLPKKLRKDSGHAYIAQNAARHPESPLEPLFRALYIEKPGFDIRKVNIVSDRSNVRKLLAFIDATTSQNGPESFTIKAEAVGDTVLLCRDDVKVEELIGPNDFKGFGLEFEKAYTTNQVAGSTGHHRIVSYRLGHLGLVIRHETDGYIDDRGISGIGAEQDDMLSSMKNLSLGSDVTDSENPPGSRVTIRKAGRQVSLASTLEIKTRVAHKPLSFDEVAAQLWVSQTPNLARAYHVRGAFSVPIVEDVSTALKGWEERKQNALLILVGTLQKISEVVKKHGRALIQYHSVEDKLTIRRAETAVNMLPDDLYLKWKNPERHDDELGQTADLGADKHKSKLSALGSSETNVRVGYDLYSIPLRKFPYLQAFVEAKTVTLGSEAEIKHEPILLFDVAFKGVVSGYRQCFRLPNIDVSLLQQLCDTYTMLQVDVLEGQSLDDIIMNIKAGKTDFESETKGNERLARDSAFRLVYHMLRRSSPSEGQENNKIFNAVLYIASHPGTFKHKARSAVRAVYDSRSKQSMKQRARLDEWKEGEDSEDDGDTSTTEPLTYYSSSDGYYLPD